jgi:hypothetical protein
MFKGVQRVVEKSAAYADEMLEFKSQVAALQQAESSAADPSRVEYVNKSFAEYAAVLEPMVGAAASAVLSREQLTREAAVVSTLVLPLSLEGCPKPGGGTYGAPWYSQQVRPSACQLTALRESASAAVSG